MLSFSAIPLFLVEILGKSLVWKNTGLWCIKMNSILVYLANWTLCALTSAFAYSPLNLDVSEALQCRDAVLGSARVQMSWEHSGRQLARLCPRPDLKRQARFIKTVINSGESARSVTRARCFAIAFRFWLVSSSWFIMHKKSRSYLQSRKPLKRDVFIHPARSTGCVFQEN